VTWYLEQERTGFLFFNFNQHAPTMSPDNTDDETLTLIKQLIIWGKHYGAHLDPRVEIYQDSETG
jgi:hypothetical protein